MKYHYNTLVYEISGIIRRCLGNSWQYNERVCYGANSGLNIGIQGACHKHPTLANRSVETRRILPCYVRERMKLEGNLIYNIPIPVSKVLRWKKKKHRNTFTNMPPGGSPGHLQVAPLGNGKCVLGISFL